MEFNQTKYVNDYNKQAYERLNVLVKKGKKEYIQKHAKELGYNSLNAYVNALIDSDMEHKTQNNLSYEEQAVINMMRYTTEKDRKRICQLAEEINASYTNEEKRIMFDKNTKYI